MGNVVLLKEARGQSDAVLIRQFRAGDASAFDEIVLRYKDRVFSVIYRYLGDYEDALSVTQETFVRAHRGLDNFRGDAQLSTWLYRIATNLARNRVRDLRRRNRYKAPPSACVDRAPADSVTCGAADAEPLPRETELLLQQCLEELPDLQRVTFILRTIEGLPYDEIASLMDCPRGTVKSRLNHARAFLRDRLKALAVL